MVRESLRPLLRRSSIVPAPQTETKDNPSTTAEQHPIAAAVAQAADATHPKPTDGQREAGNYKKGRAWIRGIEVAIENTRGSTRCGIDSNGKKWESIMPHHYGYVRRTISGADGDPVDVFIGPNPESEFVAAIDQFVDGKFDEHKFMLGFNNCQEAKAGYLAAYQPGWKGLKNITPMTLAQFRNFLAKGDTAKPLAPQAKDALRYQKIKSAHGQANLFDAGSSKNTERSSSSNRPIPPNNREFNDQHPRDSDGKWTKKVGEAKVSLFDSQGTNNLNGDDNIKPTDISASNNDLVAHALHSKLHAAGLTATPPKPVAPANIDEIKKQHGLGAKDIVLFKHAKSYRAHGADADHLKNASGGSVSIPHDKLEKTLNALIKNGHRVAIAERHEPAGKEVKAADTKSTTAQAKEPQLTQLANPNEMPESEFHKNLLNMTGLIKSIGNKFNVRGQDDLDDLVGEVQVQALRGRKSYNADLSKFTTWIGKVTENLILNKHERSNRKKRKSGYVGSLSDSPPGKNGAVNGTLADIVPDHRHEISADDKFASADAMKHIESLPPNQQAALKAKYIDGLNEAEVAKKLGKSRQSINQVVAAALAKIRVRMERGAGNSEKKPATTPQAKPNAMPVNKVPTKPLTVRYCREEFMVDLYRRLAGVRADYAKSSKQEPGQASFSFNEDDHPRAEKGNEHGGEFVKGTDSHAAAKTTATVKASQKPSSIDTETAAKRAAPGSQLAEDIKKQLRDFGMTGTFPPADVKIEDIKFNDMTRGAEALKYEMLISWDQKTKSGRISRQYRYTQEFHDRNAGEKFERVSAIEPHIKKIVDSLHFQLSDKTAPLALREAAAIASAIHETGLRPTDGDDSVKHGHFGISSLQGRHAKIVGDEIHLDFIGKEGVRNQTIVKTKANVDFLKVALAETKPDEFIFKKANSTNAGDVLKKTSKAVGGPSDIMIKDLRTLKATQSAKQIVESFKGPPPPLTGVKTKDVKLIQSAILAMSGSVAKILNNTPTQARDNYIHPEIFKKWQQSLVQN